jgi:hypothetical protein
MAFLPSDWYHFNSIFYFDKNYLAIYDKIKKDPYRYVLSDKDMKGCYNRGKRAIFVGSIMSLYIYQNLRYHQELGRIKSLKYNTIQLMHLPKAIGLAAVLYLLSNALFVDRQKIKIHTIAMFELQKFDKEYFVYNQANAGFFNVPAYKDENSVWGIMTPKRLFYDVDQTVGWIRRLRDNRPEITSEVPPKYETTPRSPRDLTKARKEWPFFSKNEFVK